MPAPTNDLELVEQYARTGSDAAFTELTHRHLDLVYSTALRTVRSPQLAEEVAQSVFTDLSRNAGRLKPGTLLTAWLYQVSRRTAIDVVRRESRRQMREQLASELNVMNSHPSVWNQIEPLLDEAMDALEAPERDAILLRFFENKSLREIGQTLGTSEDAAQKRVSRAVDRLREFLTGRGVIVGAGALTALLSAHAVQSAPIGLTAAITTLAHASSVTLQHSTALGVTKTFIMTTSQKVVLTSVVAALMGAGIYEARQASHWQEEAVAAKKLDQPLNEELQQLQREKSEMTSRLAGLQEENAELRRSTAELPKLRGEVGRLREASHELSQMKTALATSTDPNLEATLKTWAAHATRLRQRLDQNPSQRIPELQLLKDKGWLDAIKDMKTLDSDDDFSHALGYARNIAKSEFGNALRTALRSYTDANQGQLPGDLSQLKPYFDAPVDDNMLARYSLLQTGKLADIPHEEYLVAETAPMVDYEHDSRYRFSLNGTSSHSGGSVDNAIEDAGIQYAKANNGLLPTDPSQLAPYLKQPVENSKVQEMLQRIPAGVTTLQQLQSKHK